MIVRPSRSPYRRPSLALALALAASAVAAQPARPAAPTPSATPAMPSSAPTPAGHVIAEIQVLPNPIGTVEDRYKHVDAAIAVLRASGLKTEVHALGTIVEGPPEKVWPLLQAVHQATLEAGAARTMTVIKVSSGREAGGPRVEDLVRKFRD